MTILATRTTATTRATTAGEATIGLGGIAIMAGGAGTGGAADPAGMAADGTVIIDSELGHGARGPSPQRARGAFVRQRVSYHLSSLP